MRRLLSSTALLGFLFVTGCGGSDGKDGLDGEPGERGAQGPEGQGEPGAVGEQGAQGESGAQGAQGEPGEAGPGLSGPFTGTVSGASGPIAGANVALMLRGLDGTEMGLLAAAVTGADGSYSMRVANISSPASTLVLRVSTEAGMLSAILSGAATNVSVGSTAITHWVDALVADGTMPLSQFTPAEIAGLVSGAEAALVADGTDLTDHAAVLATVASALETEMAAAASATFSIAIPPNPVTLDPTDALTDIASFNVELDDGSGELWDITAEGVISDGTDDAYDSMFQLAIDGNTFPAQTAGTAEAQLEDAREVVLGPVVDLGGTGLTVTRKIYVSETLGYARFLEILSNPGVAELTVPVLIDGNLGSDEGNPDVHASSSGDALVDANDRWFTNHQDDSDPALGFLFPGAVATKTNDDVAYEWADVTVPAGGMVTLVHWGFQNTGPTPSAVQELTQQLQALPAVPPASYWTGMSIEEAAASQLMGTAVQGTAGAVVPGSTVTITVNPDGLGGFDAQFTPVSAADGSFALPLQFASGVTTTVEITTDNGTAETLTHQ